MQKTNYDFDRIIERRGTGALKTDALRERYGRDDLLPLWVADMDFATPPFIVEALRERLEHPIFGYTVEPAELWPTVSRWIGEHHGWTPDPQWMCFIPGIVKGIGMAINALLAPDEKVIIQPPVYHPFRLVPEGNGRELVYNPLILHEDGSYTMDFEQLERVCDDKCKMLILSNPHNPAGVVWPRETLRRLAQFCCSRGLVVLSDEIHCDMALFGNKHIPFPSVNEEAARCSITFGSPSKTFNIAGIVSSWAIVPDRRLRERFFGYLSANEYNDPPLFSPIATLAALTKGEQWRRDMVRYIEENVLLVERYCAGPLAPIRAIRPQASFLVWLDCRALGLDHDELIDLFVAKARLALNDGAMFGPQGNGFMRLNIGCPRARLRQALDRLAEALEQPSWSSPVLCQTGRGWWSLPL